MAVAGLRAGGDIAGTTASSRTRIRVNMEDPNDYASDVAAPDAAPGTTDSDTTAVNGGGSDVASELTDQRDKYLRLAAEYDNFRRRTTKERQEAQQRGQADLLKSMIDSLDDLGRFAHVDPATADAKTIVDGVSMVEKKLLKTLSGLGLEIINPVGEPFDPALHEAVMTEPAASPDEDHMVARVFQQGYRFNGQLLRPARVVVKQWNG
jgi:molecular chaperone GrpE